MALDTNAFYLSDREKKLVKAFRSLEDDDIQEGLVKLVVRTGER